VILEAAGLAALAGAGALCRLRGRTGQCAGMPSAARALELLLSAEVVRLGLKVFVLAPARAAGRVPFEGAERCVFFAQQSLFLARPLLAAALCWHLLARTSPARFAAIWIGLSIAFALSYPELRGEALAGWYSRAQVAGIVIALASIPAARGRIGRAQLVAFLLVAGLAAELAGPYLGDAFASWWTAQATWLPILLVVALVAVWGRTWRMRPA